ncbi:MAG: hypothetical protein C4308_02655 [Chitinophagaceae bacterium]
MKLAPLLAQYLAAEKQLNLAGIGHFTVNSMHVADGDQKTISQNLHFESDTSAKTDEGLITYISSHTGKMKALAASDLNSYLDVAKEFLNIGKPFLIEGIGTLVKRKNGLYEFTADHVLTDKIKESGIKELSATSTSDESFTSYENLKPQSEKSPAQKKLLLVFLTLITIIAVIWGGYELYQRSSKSKAASEGSQIVTDNNNQQQPVKMQADTVIKQTRRGHFKFVIEEAGKERALKRYQQLRSYGHPIEISTGDSTIFQVYFLLPASAADTARIADSLTAVYPAVNGRRTFVQN